MVTSYQYIVLVIIIKAKIMASLAALKLGMQICSQKIDLRVIEDLGLLILCKCGTKALEGTLPRHREGIIWLRASDRAVYCRRCNIYINCWSTQRSHIVLRCFEKVSILASCV